MAPEIPAAYRDASAAAIMCSALLGLAKFSTGAKQKEHSDAATTMIKSLSNYKADAKTNGGFVLKHSVGHLPAKSELDVPLTYATIILLKR